ncbi:MAG TPA: hypothetical protein VNJ09_07640 [Chthonomonadales bacterium]|nr:hypothetical protein [Chthonomonadales bacterium]
MITEINVGSLHFTVQERTFGGDGGPDIRVYGPKGGLRRQLLRFDCFRKQPHYHFDPEGRDEHHTMTPEQARDSVGWALAQIEEKLPDLIRHAGGDEEAVRDAGAPAVREAVKKIRQTLQGNG